MGSPATISRTSGTSSAIAGRARMSRSSPFDSADEPEEEERRALRRRDLARRASKTGCGMRTMRRAVDAERGQLLDGAGAVHDDAVDRGEHPPPEVDLVAPSAAAARRGP